MNFTAIYFKPWQINPQIYAWLKEPSMLLKEGAGWFKKSPIKFDKISRLGKEFLPKIHHGNFHHTPLRNYWSALKSNVAKATLIHDTLCGGQFKGLLLLGSIFLKRWYDNQNIFSILTSVKSTFFVIGFLSQGKDYVACVPEWHPTSSILKHIEPCHVLGYTRM